MISVQATVTMLTVYFFVKLLVIDKKKTRELDKTDKAENVEHIDC